MDTNNSAEGYEKNLPKVIPSFVKLDQGFTKSLIIDSLLNICLSLVNPMFRSNEKP